MVLKKFRPTALPIAHGKVFVGASIILEQIASSGCGISS
jgi:hypothetical protein